MMRRIGRTGFSLLELLAVLAVLTILAVLAGPSISSALNGSSLTQASSNVVQLLTFARQSALAQNQSVEVRFYQYADPTFPGETAGTASSGKYRALQAFAISDAAAATPIGKMERLPLGIIIDSGATLSSIIGSSSAKTGTSTSPPPWTTTAPQLALPGIGTAYNCIVVRFRPDGSITFYPSSSTPSNWCLTLHSFKYGDALAATPANFATIQVDPIAGKISTFRP